jgi:hypothetical protein
VPGNFARVQHQARSRSSSHAQKGSATERGRHGRLLQPIGGEIRLYSVVDLALGGENIHIDHHTVTIGKSGAVNLSGCGSKSHQDANKERRRAITLAALRCAK